MRRCFVVITMAVTILQLVFLPLFSLSFAKEVPKSKSKKALKTLEKKQAQADQLIAKQFVKGQIVVRFKGIEPTIKSGAGIQNVTTLGQKIVSLNKAFGTQTIKTIPGLGAVVLKTSSVEQALPRLRKRADVLYAEPNAIYKILAQATPYGVTQSKADLARVTNGVDGTGVVVAVVDTGVDFLHLDIKNNMWDGSGGCKDSNNVSITGGCPKHGWDFASDIFGQHADNNPMDENGHGTHVSGIIAAENNTIDVIGVAPKAKIMAVKVLNSNGFGSESAIADGILFALYNGAKVINLSLGSSSKSRLLEDAIDTAVAAGITVVAAAGNEYSDISSFPAAFDNVISVAALDEDNNRAWFSNFGKVDISAAGVDVKSLKLGGGTVEYSGTSMAAPHIAGIVTLILQAHPGFSAKQVTQALESTATDLGRVGKDNQFGSGLVNALTATAAAYSSSLVLVSAPRTVFADNSDSFEVTARLYNASMNPIVGENLTFSADNVTVSGGAMATDANGEVTKTVTSNNVTNRLATLLVASTSAGSKKIDIIIRKVSVDANNIFPSPSVRQLTPFFNQGESIFFVMDVFNHYYDEQDATVGIEVKDPSNIVVSDLSENFNVTIKGENKWDFLSPCGDVDFPYPCGQDWLVSDTLTIPETATEGIYTAKLTVTTDFGSTEFMGKFAVGQEFSAGLAVMNDFNLGGGKGDDQEEESLAVRTQSVNPNGTYTSSFAGYFAQSLIDLEKTYSIWDADVDGDPNTSQIEEWGLIISKDNLAYSSSGLYNFDPADYLDDGGRLIITGNYLPFNDGEHRGKYAKSDQDFYESYFGVLFNDSEFIPTTITGSDILAGTNFDINPFSVEGDGSLDQFFSDQIRLSTNDNLTTDVASIATYDASGKIAGVVVTGTAGGSYGNMEGVYKAAFLPFKFNGINDSNDRKDVLSALINDLLPAPVLDSIDPGQMYDTRQTKITISGENFVPIGQTKVYLDGNFIGIASIIDVAKLTIIIPANTLEEGMYDLAVQNPDGQQDILSDALEVIHMLAPVISSVSPSFGNNTKNTKITITGSRFFNGFLDKNPQVKIGSKNATNETLISSTKMTAVVPKGLPIGLYDVRVTNEDFQFDVKNDAFRVKKGFFLFLHNLAVGNRNNDVAELQKRLRLEGYYPSSAQITGYYGPVLSRAVSRYQSAKGLWVTGVLNDQTRAKLNEWYYGS